MPYLCKKSMDNGVQLVPVYSKDSDKVISLILPIQQIEFGVQVTLADQPDLLDIDGFYHNSGGSFWGAFKDEELVGTIALINIGHNAGAIRKMFVKKAYRGKETGIAGKLLQELLLAATEKNMKDIFLGTVPVLQAAQRFYERNGFTKIAADSLPPYFPRMHADSIFYHLQIDARKNVE